MFVLCPHCQFLVTLDPVSGQPPARCPRCEQALSSAAAGSDNPGVAHPPRPAEAGADATASRRPSVAAARKSGAAAAHGTTDAGRESSTPAQQPPAPAGADPAAVRPPPAAAPRKSRTTDTGVAAEADRRPVTATRKQRGSEPGIAATGASAPPSPARVPVPEGIPVAASGDAAATTTSVGLDSDAGHGNHDAASAATTVPAATAAPGATAVPAPAAATAATAATAVAVASHRDIGTSAAAAEASDANSAAVDAPASAAPSPTADAVAAVVHAPAVDANDVDAPPVADTVDAVVDAPTGGVDTAAVDADAVGAAVAATPPAPTSTATPALPRMRRARAHRPAPSFARVPVAGTARPPHRHWRQPAAIAALLLVLLLQLLLADRARLAADARWRPLVATLCGALHCSVPAWREPAAFTLLHRDVRPHPTRPGVLQVSATFRNDARWPQPWPALLLTLADVDGRSAGARAFLPREYLGAAPPTPLLARGQSATVAMDILEPAPRIVAFTFDFR